MRRAKTPSFILELPLRTTAKDRKVLDTRFDAARQLYNACLGEALKRLELLRESRSFHDTRRLPRGETRTAAFRELNSQFGFREFDLHRYAGEIRQSWIGDHINSDTGQTIASRAFAAVQQYAFGKRGRPRFKGKRGLHSLEGKRNSEGIRFRNEHIEWSGLSLRCLIDRDDPVVVYGLSKTIKYCRLMRRNIRGNDRWYAQLVVEGRPFQKPEHAVRNGVVGLDVGPSTVAIVGTDEARLATFCAALANKDTEVRRLQRALDRSRRATNPDNYNPDGTARKGAQRWRYSRNYRRLRARKAELERKLAAHRKSLHGQLANAVLRLGTIIKTEKVSYRAFQRMFGRSVSRRAPGLFVSMLGRKAASAGGRLETFSTRKTRLSQTCICGRIEKKPLRQRVHRCSACGIEAQRDLFSGYLAQYVSDDSLDVASAAQHWRGADQLLREAASRAEDNQAARPTAKRRKLRCRKRGNGRSSCFPKRGIAKAEARDGVAVAPTTGESPGKASSVS